MFKHDMAIYPKIELPISYGWNFYHEPSMNGTTLVEPPNRHSVSFSIGMLIDPFKRNPWSQIFKTLCMKY